MNIYRYTHIFIEALFPWSAQAGGLCPRLAGAAWRHSLAAGRHAW